MTEHMPWAFYNCPFVFDVAAVLVSTALVIMYRVVNKLNFQSVQRLRLCCVH